MLKKIVLFFTLSINFNSLAWDHSGHNTSNRNVNFSVERLANEVNRLTHMYARELNSYEKRDLKNLLKQARELLLFADGPFRACSLQEPEKVKIAFLTIKQVAQANVGLNMPSVDAVKYARNWLGKYSCTEADRFMKLIKNMRLFTGAKTGMNMTKDESINYTLNFSEKFCGDNRFENDYRSWYQLARSVTGMNLSEEEARAYAQNQMERFHFSCQI